MCVQWIQSGSRKLSSTLLRDGWIMHNHVAKI